MRNKTGEIPFHTMTHGTFAFLWRVSGAGYSINKTLKAVPEQTDAEKVDQEPPWLVPKGELLRQYTPLAESTLHRKFVKLDEADQEQILSFANRYGLLGGHDCLLVPPNGGELMLGESLSRWQHEIQQMSIILAIWDLVCDLDDDRLGQIISWPNPDRVEISMSWRRQGGKIELGKHKGSPYYSDFIRTVSTFPTPQSGVEGVEYDTIADRQDKTRMELLDRWDKGNVIKPALYYVCLQVNQRVRNYVSPQVLPFRKLELRVFPQTLLSAMWLMFMWEISGENNVFLCPSCLEWFSTEDRRRKHCSDACKQKAYREREKRKKNSPELQTLSSPNS